MDLMLLFTGAARADDNPSSKVDDRFANEPARPRAGSPIQFSQSWEEACAQAKRTRRRLLVYFTGNTCGWCRALEKRTFTDSEVVELSKLFVCVEINVGEERNARLADAHRIDSIPRTFIFTPDGKVIDRRSGYLPAAEYADWLMRVGDTPTANLQTRRQPTAPAAVGFGEDEADVVIWFVDASKSIERWNDPDWTSHSHLRRILGSAGLRPRIEHIARDDFAARWDRAKATGNAPDLIAPEKLAGLVRALEMGGQLIHVQSERLSWMTEVASCTDFAARWRFLNVDSLHKASARKALDELCRPGPETSLPGLPLPDSEDRDKATVIARKAAVGFVSGDPRRLREVASASSPQLSRCTAPEDFRSGWTADAGAVELRGNACIAFAKVEISYRGKNVIGADPFLVVLRREPTAWKAFAVTNDVLCMKELPGLCRLSLRRRRTGPPPPVPRLLSPAEGGVIGGKDHKSLSWNVPAESEPLAAQVCQALLNMQKGRSWPDIRFKVYPGDPRARSISTDDSSLTGVSSDKMSWCVWSIGQDGQTSVSEVRSYHFATFKY
jgi:thioredoxin-related protein